MPVITLVMITILPDHRAALVPVRGALEQVRITLLKDRATAVSQPTVNVHQDHKLVLYDT